LLCILNIFSMHATSHLRASPSRGLKIVDNIHLCVLRMLLVAASGLYMPVSAGSLTVSAQPTFCPANIRTVKAIDTSVASFTAYHQPCIHQLIMSGCATAGLAGLAQGWSLCQGTQSFAMATGALLQLAMPLPYPVETSMLAKVVCSGP